MAEAAEEPELVPAVAGEVSTPGLAFVESSSMVISVRLF